MSCWKCECGHRNCDTDECQNPKCVCKTIKYKEAMKAKENKFKTTISGTFESDMDLKGYINTEI